MAKRGRNKSQRTRDDAFISSPDSWLRFENSLLRPIVSFSPSDVRDLDDGRRFDPTRDQRGPRGVTRSSTRLVSSTGLSKKPITGSRNGHRVRTSVASLFSAPPAGVEFNAPKEVSVCVRRKERREVLHAIHRAGKAGQRRPKWTPASHISCRRRK